MNAIRLRRATAADAAALAAIVQPLITPWLVPDGHVGATARMQREHSAAAIAAHVAEGWPYWLAARHDADGEAELLGYIALKPPAHLFNLYVRADWHGRGVGRALWQVLRQHVQHAGSPAITVNASLRAQAVYQNWGFAPAGEPQCHVGLWFQPMRFTSDDLRGSAT